ncbi:MAG: tetratricopeptide repeat protein [Polyangiales bacterium]
MSVRRSRFAAALLALTLSLTPFAALADLRGARDAYSRGDYADAERQVRALRPNERTAGDRVLARIYLETGRYDEVIEIGQRLARAPASRAEGLTIQGEALAAKGDRDAALARWNEAITAGPARSARRARAFAATWLARMGRRDEAREAATPLIDEYNDAGEATGARAAVLRDAEFLLYVGMAAKALGSVRDANAAFNESLHIDATRVETNLAQAELMLSTEDLQPAGEALRAALTANPHSARGLVLRARTRLVSELDFTRAGDDLTAALAVNPRVAEAYALRAAIVLRDGDIAAADRLLNEGTAINAHDPSVLAMRGVVRFFADDREGFRRAFDALFAEVPRTPKPTRSSETSPTGSTATPRPRSSCARASLAPPSPPIAASARAHPRRARDQPPAHGTRGRGPHGLRASFEASRFSVRVANLLNLYEQTMGAE